MADEKTTPNEIPNAAPNAVDSDKAFEVVVNTEGEKAQVMGQPHPPKALTEVHTTHVRTDRVILDTSDPLAVQVPPKSETDGRTPASLAFENAQSPEDKLAAEAKKK